MSTTLNTPLAWNSKIESKPQAPITSNKWQAFINEQTKYTTAWFLVSLVVQGIFFLPIPALLIFSFGAPVYILIFTLGLFFSNIIAGMSGAGIKAILYLFASSIVIHVALLAIFML